MFFDEIMAQAPFFQDAGKGSGTGPDISPTDLPHVAHGWAGDSQNNCIRR